jgi:hypothetical protein
MEEKNLKGRIKKIKTKLRCFIIYMSNKLPCYLVFSFLFVSGEKKVNNSYILLECVITLLGHEIESNGEKLI